MPTRQTPPPGAGWQYNPDTRGWHNTRTGANLSRRQYDERYGRLARQGIPTNEAQGRALRAAGVAPGPARGRLKHTTHGDTDFFPSQRTLNGYLAKLRQLLRHNYTAVRFIYARPGEVHVSTNWFALSAGNIPYILQQLLQDFQYDDATPLYHFRDIELIGAIK